MGWLWTNTNKNFSVLFCFVFCLNYTTTTTTTTTNNNNNKIQVTFPDGKLCANICWFEQQFEWKNSFDKVTFIQLFTNLYCYVCVFRNTNIVHFTPEGSTGGFHQGFVGYLYKAQISQYAVLVVVELLTAIIVEHNWTIQVWTGCTTLAR